MTNDEPGHRYSRIFSPPRLVLLASAASIGAIVALGRVAHDAAFLALGERPGKFAHGAVHRLARGMALFDSYHCSRYNTNTRRLTPAMFSAIFEAAGRHLSQ